MAVRALRAALAMWGLLAPAGAAAAVTERSRQDDGVRMQVAPDVPINVAVFCDINTMGDSLPLMRVQWQPPASGPAPLAYKVYVNDTLIDTVNANSWMETKLTHLEVGTHYKLSVSAVNTDGESPRVDVYQTAAVLPDPPRNVQVSAGSLGSSDRPTLR